MATTYLGNIKGPAGPIGPQGIPGTGAVPADAAVAGYISTLGSSATKTVLESRLAVQERADLTHKVHPNGMKYSVLRVNTGGRFLPGLVEKVFASDYEQTWTSGTPFAPPKEDIRSIAKRKMATVVINGSAWNLVDNVMRGAQIKDGISYHDMTSTGHWQDADAIGVLASGEVRGYSALNGDTNTTMLNAGVVDSFTFGPLLVRNGVKANLAAMPFWDPYSSSLSSVAIFGQAVDGSLIIIMGQGVSGSSGLQGQDVADLAFAEGCHVAMALDRGGSAQMRVNNTPVMISSDATGYRPVPDFLCLTVPLASEVVSQPYNIPLDSGFTGPFLLRARGSIVHVEAKVSGTLPVGATVVGFERVPQAFRPSDNIRSMFALNADPRAGIYCTAFGTIGILNQRGSSGTAGEGSMVWDISHLN